MSALLWELYAAGYAASRRGLTRFAQVAPGEHKWQVWYPVAPVRQVGRSSYTLQEVAGFAVLRRPAYPMVEFWLGVAGRGCGMVTRRRWRRDYNGPRISS